MACLDDGNAWAAEGLTREPGWVLDAALTHSGDGNVFAAYLHSASSRETAELRLGKKSEQVYADAEKLHKQLDHYACGPPPHPERLPAAGRASFKATPSSRGAKAGGFALLTAAAGLAFKNRDKLGGLTSRGESREITTRAAPTTPAPQTPPAPPV